MNCFIVIFIMNYYKIKTQTKLYFELGNNYNIPRKNITILEKIPNKNGDSALIPLKDIPKNKPLW